MPLQPNSDTFTVDKTDTPATDAAGPAKKSAEEPKAKRAELPEVVSGANPLVCAANNLLNLIPQLRASTSVPLPSALREYLLEEIRLFERRAREFGVTEESIVGARYCLCTVVDETAAQTPWGGSGIWPTYSLLVAFHNETWGGEKFFMLLSRLAQNPQQHHDLLELMYYCIALGFEGRYRIMDNGHAQLETVKRRLFDILQKSRDEYSRPLAQHWRGIEGEAKKILTMMPLWVAAACALLLMLIVYFWLSFILSSRSDPLFTKISGIRMPRITITNPSKPVPARLAQFLEPEIREGLVSVRDEADRSTIILHGDGMFAPGSDIILPRYVNVVNRVSTALNSVGGTVLVNGYTDNSPIRSLRFPSNWHLSQARANAVKQMLDGRLAQTGRTRAEGRADADPVAPNDNPANRARNRRVEITLMLAPSERDAQLGNTNVQ